MALVKAMALGAIGGIAIPYVLREEAGLLGRLADYGTVRPLPGTFGFALSFPIFLAVTLLGWALLKAAEDR